MGMYIDWYAIRSLGQRRVEINARVGDAVGAMLAARRCDLGNSARLDDTVVVGNARGGGA